MASVSRQVAPHVAWLVLATPDAVIGAVAESGGVEVGDGLVATGLSIALRDDPLGLFDGVCHVEIVNTNCSRNQQETGENFNTFTSSDNNVPRQPCQQPHRIQQLGIKYQGISKTSGGKRVSGGKDAYFDLTRNQ